MRFAFTDDQLAFRDAVRDLLAKECPPEVVRAAWPEGTDESGARKGEGARADADRVAKVWSDLAEMGVLGIAVPEDQGGLGMSEVDWVLLAEETGYSALPHPFVETACVVAPLLASCGDPDGVLADVIGGDRFATVAERADRVPWAAHDPYVVLAPRDGTEVLHLTKPSADPIPAELVDASRSLGAFNAYTGNALAGADAGLIWDRGALGSAAQLVGLGRRMLDLTVAYVAERKQFGVPIGSQQAVKHHLADAAMQLRFAAPAVYGAAWSMSTGQPTASRDVSMAKALASDAARLTARKALQCHGAIGYTVEYDLHLYLKRAEALARAWGDAAHHRDRVATALGI
jgi:alkylation response protein AidB-like acyl-CoA dehydrogenase